MLIIAHRGASGEFPENTQSAYEQAIIQQADAIELDVQYHSLGDSPENTSGSWWVMHDLYVDETTSGQGRLQALAIDDIKKLHTHDNQPILQLHQALAIINQQCLVNIEVKISNGDDQAVNLIAKHLITEIARCIKLGYCQWPNINISSFNHLFLQAIKQLKPDINIGALIAHCPTDLAAFAKTLGASTLNPNINCLNKALVDNAHQHGLNVWVYTVDRPQDMAFCQRIGVDAIFTNFPAQAKKYFSSIS